MRKEINIKIQFEVLTHHFRTWFILVNMLIKLSLIVLTVLHLTRCDYNDSFTDILSNRGLNVLQIIKKYGYPLERHRVITEDGYILEMQRIPHGIYNKNIKKGPPILINHGLLGSSREFVIMGNKSMAFYLSEAGYDIWLANNRGTVWSRKHVTLNPEYQKFWLFSFHELGVYDYPAQINYIVNLTKEEKIFVIGHSQGGTAYFVMASERPEMNEKVRLAILMAPSAQSKHCKNSVMLSAIENADWMLSIAYSLGIYEIPFNVALGNLMGQWCLDSLKFLCDAITNIAMGFDINQIDLKIVPAVVTNLPGGSSVQCVEHYAQIYRSKRFQKFDYGTKENLQRYGTTSPPTYDLNNVVAPVALMYGRNDALVNYQDVEDLADDLPNVVFKYLVPYEMWNHIGYLFAKNATDLIYDKIIEWITQF